LEWNDFTQKQTAKQRSVRVLELFAEAAKMLCFAWLRSQEEQTEMPTANFTMGIFYT